MGFASWNANRINGDRLADVLDDLVAGVGRRIFLLQEVSSWVRDPAVEGWHILHEEFSTAAIALPWHLGANIRWRNHSAGTASVLLGDLGIVSAYLADSGKSIDEYVQTVEELSTQMSLLRDHGAKHLIVGCDAQVEIQPNLVNFSGPAALGLPDANATKMERQSLLVSTLKKFGLKAASTWIESGSCFTRRPWQQGRRCTQLDYIFHSKSLSSQSGIHNFRRFGSSDHYPVWTTLTNEEIKLSKPKPVRSVAGWRPNNADQFAKAVTCSLGITGSNLDVSSSASLTEIQRTIEASALHVPHSTRQSRTRDLQRKPQELKDLEIRVMATPKGPERRVLKREEKKMYRKWKSALLIAKGKLGWQRTKKSLQCLECDGQVTEDRTEWKAELDRHCRAKFYDPYMTLERQNQWVAQLRSIQHNTELDGIRAPLLSVGIVLQARSRMKTGKSPGGGELIVTEMLMELPIIVVYYITKTFQDLYSGSLRDGVQSWKVILLVFLAKYGKANKLSEFRNISLLSVMGKWYMSCLTILAARSPPPRKWSKHCVFGYVPGMRTEHITSSLHLLLNRGMEWHEQVPIFLFGGDILAAFDNLHPEVAIKGLQAARLHPRLIAAIAAESVGLQCSPNFQGVHLEHAIPFTRCIRQGGVESTIKWNNVMHMVLESLVPIWVESGYGISLDNIVYTHLVWADNIWLLSHSYGDLRKMVTSLTAVLALHRLYWKPTSLEVLSSTPELCAGFDIEDGHETMYVKPVESMEILGTVLHKSGSTEVQLDHRLAKATAAFHAEKDLYCDKAASLFSRFQRFSTRIIPMVLHGCGSWAWSRSLYQTVLSWESRHLRAMLGAKWTREVEWFNWLRTTTHVARNHYLNNGFTPITVKILHSIHRLASQQLFAAEADAPHTLLPSACRWRDGWWWQQQKAHGALLDPAGKAGWKHASNMGNRGRKWDDVLIASFGHEWHLIAQTKDWASTFETLKSAAFQMVRVAIPRAPDKVSKDEIMRKRRQVPPAEEVSWTPPPEGRISFELIGDNETVIGWVNGREKCDEKRHQGTVEEIRNTLHEAWQRMDFVPRQAHCHWARHVYREYNKHADELATMALAGKTAHHVMSQAITDEVRYLRAHFDGGRRHNSAGAGWTAEVSSDAVTWNLVATGNKYLGADTSIAAELEAARLALRCAQTFVKGVGKGIS